MTDAPSTAAQPASAPAAEGASPGARPGWRKRHPLLARVLLYGVGVVLATVAVWSYLDRRATDRADRERYLWNRLAGLDLVFMQDPSGRTLLDALDEDFADPAIAAPIRFRALRWRAVAQVERRDLAAAEDALSRANTLATTTEERDAVRIERAEARAQLGSTEDALATLGDLGEGSAPTATIAVLGSVVRAYALERADRKDEAAATLREALAKSAGAPGDVAPVWVGSRSWTPVDAAEVAKLGLQRLDGVTPTAGATAPAPGSLKPGTPPRR